MDDLRSRAAAFLRGPYVLGKGPYLISRYVCGELWDDPKALNLLSLCLQTALIEVGKSDGVSSGSGRDITNCYRKMAELLEDIKAELLAQHPQ